MERQRVNLGFTVSKQYIRVRPVITESYHSNISQAIISGMVTTAMKLITVKMPEIYVDGIDELVKNGRYSSRSEVIRTAIRELLKQELWGGMGAYMAMAAFKPDNLVEMELPG